MSCIAVGEHLSVNTLTAYDIDIFRRIGAQFSHQFLYAVHDRRVPDFVGTVRGQHNVYSAVEGLPHGESLQCLSAVNDDLVKRLLPEHPLVTGDPDQKLSLVAYGPVLIHCSD